MNRYIITDHGVNADAAELQTEKIQAVLDKCKNGGGTVVIPKGKFRVASLYLHSDTTLYLESGAILQGSDECNDYEVYLIRDGIEMRSDMELITQYYGKPWETYRRAIISSYGEKNVSIIGEPGSFIDGSNCYDPDGEEKYRGPHAVFFTCCENVLFEGYTARHSGNFLHEANNCRNLTMRKVTCLGGSDGIHLHCTEDALIEDCLFKTGDDCIAGINVKNLLVRRCVIENAEKVLHYTADVGTLQNGTHLGTFTLENVTFTDLKKSSAPIGNADESLTVVLKNVEVDFCEGAVDTELFSVNDASNTVIKIQ